MIALDNNNVKSKMAYSLISGSSCEKESAYTSKPFANHLADG